MNLILQEAAGCPNLLSPAVYHNILKLNDKRIMAAQIDPEYADGLLLHEKYATPLEAELNCLIIEGKRNDISSYAAVLLPYGRKMNTNSILRQAMGAKKVSFAPLDYVLENTDMEYGSISPLGIPENWKLLIAEEVFAVENIIIGGGLVISKVFMPSALLKDLDNVEILQGLIKE